MVILLNLHTHKSRYIIILLNKNNFYTKKNDLKIIT